MRRICLFGTSANPPTGNGGHVGIVSALASLTLSDKHDDGSSTNTPSFDEVWVLPVYQHMYAEKRTNRDPSFDDRWNMCQIAFGHILKVTVSDWERVCFERHAEGMNEEQKKELRVGTADLLEMILRSDMTAEYTLALGSDTFMDLTSWKWKRSRDVLHLLQGRILVIHRICCNEDGGSNEDHATTHYQQNNASTGETCKLDVVVERIRTINAYLERRNADCGNDATMEKRFNSSSEHCRRNGENNLHNVKGTAAPMHTIRMINIASLSLVSSTLVRQYCHDGNEEAVLDIISPEILAYIKEKKLYDFGCNNSTT